MISQLTGTVVTAGATWFVIDVHGVGYRATTTPAAAAALRPGEVSTVYTSMVVRQDSLSLFAFLSADEREAFELVQTASASAPSWPWPWSRCWAPPSYDERCSPRI